MNFAGYLTELLKSNDCVIIPDLGGFIANYLPSSINQEGDQFYPPAKEFIFNGKLRKNDGLLVNYICEREDIGYLEARKIVSEFVAECVFKLENGEKIELEQIGTLSYDQNEHLHFEADRREVIRTDAFGLYNFHFPQITVKYTQPTVPVFRDKEPQSQTHRRPVLKYAMLAIPLVAALYLIPRFVLRDAAVQTQTANTASLAIRDTPASFNHEATHVITPVVTPPKADSVKTEKLPSPGTPVAEPVQVKQQAAAIGSLPTEKAAPLSSEHGNGRFHVVGGCFKVRENADKLALKLEQQGYHPQVASLGKDYFRVSVESFESRKDAEKVLARLQDEQPGNGYWLMVEKR